MYGCNYGISCLTIKIKQCTKVVMNSSRLRLDSDSITVQLLVMFIQSALFPAQCTLVFQDQSRSLSPVIARSVLDTHETQRLSKCYNGLF